MRSFLWSIAVACWLLGAGSAPAHAQTDDSPAPKLPTLDDTSSAGVAGPDTLYLPDKDGRLKPVIGYRYEDFVKARGILNRVGGATQEPAFILESFDLHGKVVDGNAQLECKARVSLRSDRWVRIPLALADAVLADAPQLSTKAEHFLHYAKQPDGYVLWIKDKPKTEHVLTLKLLLPVEKVGEESVLACTAPEATMSSFAVDVDTPEALARVSEGAMLTSPPRKVGAEKGTTQLAGKGIEGPFELAWRTEPKARAEAPVALEATGEILVRVDSHIIRSVANLKVRSFRGQFDRFLVQLPQGGELVEEQRPGYTLSVVAENRNRGQTVEVKLPRKTTGPVDVRITSRRLREGIAPTRPIDLAGFQVVSAVRQWGHLAIDVAGEWQLLLGEMRNVRQVQELPEALRRENLFAGFEYYSQPFKLAVRVGERTSRVRVEPEHLVLIGDDEATLQSKLQYTVRGSKVFSFDIDLAGWEFDTIGPPTIVDVDNVVLSADGKVNVRLLQPTTGAIGIELTARRTIDPKEGELDFSFPVPAATSHTPADIIILADDDVELSPRPDAMQGLTAIPLTPSVELPLRQQEPLFYRADQPSARFSTAMEVQLQQIAVEVSSHIDIGDTLAHVSQTFSYRVDYRPVERLSFDVPRLLSGRQQVLVQFDGQSLSLASLVDDTIVVDPSVEKMRVTLPAPARIGRFDVQVEYDVPLESFSPQQSTLISIPLIMPIEGKLDRNIATVAADDRIQVAPRQGAWNVSATTRPERGVQMTFSSERHHTELPLGVSMVEAPSLKTTVVERAWFQTWLSQTVRQDRACYRLVTSDSQIAFVLPGDVSPGKVEVLVDGQVIAPETDADGQLVVSLPRQVEPRPIVVELRYHLPAEDTAGRFDVPRLAGEAWLQHVYWQLILPEDQHLLVEPPGMTREFDWTWNGVYWGRRPLLGQPQLETWCGAVTNSAPAPTTNRYLFSSLGAPPAIEIGTARRSAIVLLTAGAVLLAGLVLLYWPASRQPGVLFAAAVVLLALGFRYPEPSLVLAQLAALGLVLVSVAAVLKLFIARRRPEPTSTLGSSIELSSRASTQPYRPTPTPEAAADSSAATTIAHQDGDGAIVRETDPAESGITS